MGRRLRRRSDGMELQGPELQDMELQGPELQAPELQGPELQGPELQDMGPQRRSAGVGPRRGCGVVGLVRRLRRVGEGRGRGSVTAETAVALPALVLVLTISLWAVAIAGAQLRCVDAAREGARAAARGETSEEVNAAVLRVAPKGATVSIGTEAGITRVDVVATISPPWRSPLPPVRLKATAVSATEPGILPPPTVAGMDASGSAAAEEPPTVPKTEEHE